MAVRLGTNPIAWTNDDLLTLGDAISVDTCLAEARQAGFAGIELGRKFPRRAEELGPILDRHGLRLVSGWYGARLRERDAKAEIAELQPHLQLLQALGCEVMVFAEMVGAIHGDRAIPLSRRPRLAESEWAPFTRRLTEVADYLAETDMPMAYHHHMGTAIESEDDVDRLMAETGPSVGLLFDTGHLTLAGGDPVSVAARHAARVRHVHCKDVRSRVMAAVRNREASFLDAVVEGVFTTPGGGAVDFVASLTPIAQAGHSGWLVVEAEQDPEKAPPLLYGSMGYAALAVYAREAGFDVVAG
jgi:inosose dehydratase